MGGFLVSFLPGAFGSGSLSSASRLFLLALFLAPGFSISTPSYLSGIFLSIALPCNFPVCRLSPSFSSCWLPILHSFSMIHLSLLSYLLSHCLTLPLSLPLAMFTHVKFGPRVSTQLTHGFRILSSLSQLNPFSGRSCKSPRHFPVL